MQASENLLCLAQISLLALRGTKQWAAPTGLTGSKGRGHPLYSGGGTPPHPGAATGIAIAPNHPSLAPLAVIMIQSHTFLSIAGLENYAVDYCLGDQLA